MDAGVLNTWQFCADRLVSRKAAAEVSCYLRKTLSPRLFEVPHVGQRYVGQVVTRSLDSVSHPSSAAVFNPPQCDKGEGLWSGSYSYSRLHMPQSAAKESLFMMMSVVTGRKLSYAFKDDAVNNCSNCPFGAQGKVKSHQHLYTCVGRQCHDTDHCHDAVLHEGFCIRTKFFLSP